MLYSDKFRFERAIIIIVNQVDKRILTRYKV
jgi:hypothetical protein